MVSEVGAATGEFTKPRSPRASHGFRAEALLRLRIGRRHRPRRRGARGPAVANSPLGDGYRELIGLRGELRIADAWLVLAKPLSVWVNDLWMAVFFFLVGLEIKRELLAGELASRRQAALPAAAALGGMVVPALIYVALNRGDPVAVRGWAIPMATDIAFALGVVALLGARVPASLKVFLAAVAIIDDLGAIVVIGLFYTDELSLPMLAAAAVGALCCWR